MYFILKNGKLLDEQSFTRLSSAISFARNNTQFKIPKDWDGSKIGSSSKLEIIKQAKTVKLPEKVVVDRDKWYRGQEEGSVLLKDDGRKCCLGFACEQAGVHPALLRNIISPDELLCTRGVEVQTLIRRENPFGNHNSAETEEMMYINDRRWHEVKRELNLNIEAKQAGFQFEFIN